MWMALLGLLVGILLGWFMPLAVPNIYARYLGIAVIAALDSALGGVRASLQAKFNTSIFLTGFFTNVLLAVGLTFVGERLGVDLYLAAVVALGIRMFNNLGIIRRHLLTRWRVLRTKDPGDGAESGPGGEI